MFIAVNLTRTWPGEGAVPNLFATISVLELYSRCVCVQGEGNDTYAYRRGNGCDLCVHIAYREGAVICTYTLRTEGKGRVLPSVSAHCVQMKRQICAYILRRAGHTGRAAYKWGWKLRGSRAYVICEWCLWTVVVNWCLRFH